MHLIPFAAAIIYLTIKLYFIPIPITCRSNHVLLGSIAFAHTFIYFFSSNKELNNNRLDTISSSTLNNKKSLGWLPLFIYGCSVIWLTKLLFFIVWDISGYYRGCNEIINLHFLVVFLLFNTFLYFLLIKPQIFTPIEKYKYSILSDTAKQKYIKMLISLMEKEKAYRNPLISLNLLAKQLSIPSRHLSQLINETLNISFYDFINWYRIQDCVKYLSDSDNSQKTILEIAYEVGFNSKSTFNSSFTKFVGVTPKEFRKSNQEIFNLKGSVFSMNLGE